MAMTRQERMDKFQAGGALQSRFFNDKLLAGSSQNSNITAADSVGGPHLKDLAQWCWRKSFCWEVRSIQAAFSLHHARHQRDT